MAYGRWLMAGGESTLAKYCTKGIFWSLVLFVFLYPLIVSPFLAPVFTLPKLAFLRILSVLILFAWAMKAVDEGRIKLFHSPLNLPLFFFVLLALVSTLFSVHPLTSLFGQYSRWEGLLTLFSYLFLCLTAMNFIHLKRQFKILLAALLSSASLLSALAILEHFWTNPFLLIAKAYCPAGFGEATTYEFGRSFASLGNPLNLGAYLTLTFPIAAALFLSGELKPKFQWLLALSSVLMLTALFFTYGRAAWLGTGAALIFLLAFSLRRLRTHRALQAAFVGIILVSLIVAYIPVGKGGFNLLQRAASILRIEYTTVPRLQMWRATLPLIVDYPLIGSGLDTYKLVFPRYKPAGWVIYYLNPQLDKAHNDLLQVTATMGILGLIAYLWVLGTFFREGLGRMKRMEDSYGKTLLIGFLAAGLAYLIQLQFNFSHLTTAPLFWLMVGLVFGTGRIGLPEPLQPALNLQSRKFGRKKIAHLLGLTSLALILVILSAIPLAADIYFNKGLESQYRKQWAEAARRYERATNLYPFEAIYFISLGEANIKQAAQSMGTEARGRGYLKFAQLAFERAQRLNPLDENAFFRAGSAYLELGRKWRDSTLLTRVISTHRKGLALNPNMTDSYLDIGVAYAYLAQYAQAIQEWRKTLEIDPGSSRAYFNLGWAYEQKGEVKKAREAYKKAYKLDPEMTEAKEALDRLENSSLP